MVDAAISALIIAATILILTAIAKAAGVGLVS